MTLSDIAEGVATTDTQETRGVAVVDRTSDSIEAVLEPFAEELPVDAAVAAELVEAYRTGTSVGEAATAAGLPPVRGAKVLFRLGFEGLSPLSPLQRDICRDWLAGELTRTEARELADAGERAFALGAYIETHEPVPGAAEAVEDAAVTGADAMVEKREALDETMTDAADLF